MSRTRAHRPYAVQARERGTAVYHDHHRFGEDVTRQRKVRDADGQVVTEDAYKQLTIKAALPLHPLFSDGTEVADRKRKVAKEAKLRRSVGEPLDTLIDGWEPITRPVYKTVVIGRYADYCTEDEPVDDRDRLLSDATVFAPCTRHLTGAESAGAFGRSKPEKAYGYHRDWRNSTRRRFRNEARMLARAAASDIDPDDFIEPAPR